MPELPEVETTVQQLQESLPGRRVAGLTLAAWPRQFVTHTPDEFGRLIAGRQVVRVTRRAKFALLELEGDHYIAVHRKMSGDLLLMEPGTELSDVLKRKLDFTRATIAFDDGSELKFTDARKFGRLHLYTSKAALEEYFTKVGLGVEPLTDDFNEALFLEALAHRKGRIKSLLLAQTIVVGLGNIYCDEALFRAKIHPLRTAESLSSTEASALYTAIKTVLEEGVASNGTTFSGYIDAFGRKGSYQFELKVYPATRQKKGEAPQKCTECQTVIAHEVIGGRTSHFCPSCQPSPQKAAS